MTEQPAKQFTAVVLAGDRSDADPVATEAGTVSKAIAPVCGKPMVLRVIDALQASGQIKSIILCGPQEAALKACPELSQRITSDNITWVPGEDSPSKSAEAGLSQVAPDQAVLVTTADHALLTPEIVKYFIQESSNKTVDASFGLVEYECIRATFPGVRRTVIKLSDGGYCGCNLFAFMSEKGRKLVPFWRKVEQDRKQPWKIVAGIIGIPAIISYILGRLSLESIVHRLSGRLDLSLDAVLMPYAEVGIDVDTPEDRKFVEEILSNSDSP